MEFSKRLSIGIQSFQRIIEGNFIYIDKTKHIYDLIKAGECYFLSRPRRFGKSLLVSTLEEIFLGNKKLFESLYITKTNYDWKVYSVISISFAGLSSTNAHDLKQDLIWTLENIALKHKLDINSAPTIKTKLKLLIELLYAKAPVVILIDEYDYPILSNINDLKIAEECRIVLKDFFDTVKDSGKYIKFIFITGITKFSKTSIFSGLNNLKDLTLSNQASQILGYTQEEIALYFDEYIKAIEKKENITKELFFQKIKKWYNGYQFVEDHNQLKVYNPFSILIYLSEQKFSNYWFDTGTPSFLIHLIKTQEYPIAKIDESEVNIEDTKSYDIERIQLIPLLWQTGYLTIESFNPITQNYKLTYPNEEVKISFLHFFLKSLTNTEISSITNFVVEFSNAIKKNNLETFLKALQIYFANIPYSMQLALEKYYQSIFYVILSLIGAYVKAEIATSEGRIDTVLETNQNIYIIEFKLGQSAQKALQQIEDKKYYQKYLLSKKQIFLVGVEFNVEKRNLTDWEIKKI